MLYYPEKNTTLYSVGPSVRGVVRCPCLPAADRLAFFRVPRKKANIFRIIPGLRLSKSVDVGFLLRSTKNRSRFSKKLLPKIHPSEQKANIINFISHFRQFSTHNVGFSKFCPKKSQQAVFRRTEQLPYCTALSLAGRRAAALLRSIAPQLYAAPRSAAASHDTIGRRPDGGLPINIKQGSPHSGEPQTVDKPQTDCMIVRGFPYEKPLFSLKFQHFHLLL